MGKTTATIFIALICIINYGCSVQRNEPLPYQSKLVYDQGGSRLYTMQPRLLIRGFWGSNQVAIYQEYMGKRVAVEGPIDLIYMLSNGDPALTLSWYDTVSSSFIGLVACQFSKVFINHMAEMRSGQNVIVIGTVSDYTSGHRSYPTVHLKDCIFAQPAPQPAQPVKNQ